MNYLERLKKPRATGLLALAALLFFFAACQLVAGVQSRTLDPIASGCALPSGGGPQVRFANFAPNPDALDICIRATGTSWGEPLILNGGSNCSTLFPAKGFTYGQITIPFAAPAGTVDVKTVLGGGTCNSSAVGEVDGVKLLSAPACTATNCVTTLIAIGGAAGKPKALVALPEYDQPATGGGEFLRFVDTLAGVGAMDVGTIAKPASGKAQLPASLVPPAWNLTTPIPYGGTMTKGEQNFFGEPTGDNGYVGVIGGQYNLVATAHGQTDGLLLFPGLETGSEAGSIYAIGLAYNDSYPLEGLDCTETENIAGSNGLLIGCTTSALPTLSFDAFNPALYGPNSPYFNLRDPLYQSSDPKTNPISSRNSDVMCLVEVDTTQDQQGIIAAVKGGNFNYSYTITTNLSTPFTNGGVEQDGGACPTSTQPACASVPTNVLQAAFTCMEQNCSSNGAMGTLNTTTDCLSNSCTPQLGGLFAGYPQCLDCVLANVSSGQQYSVAQSTCTTNPSPPLGYQGGENSLVLSKYPIVSQDSYVLPSSYYRRSVLYTEVQFPGNVTIDFYCGFLQTLGIASDLPYEGCFGGGATSSEDGYTNENLYEAKLMAAWIQAKSKKSGNPAVIMGDWHTGLGSTVAAEPDAGFPAPTAVGPGTINFLSGVFTAVNGPNWPAAGQCTDCPGTVNLLNAPNTTSYFTFQPFLYNWPTGSGTLNSEQLIFTDNVIAIPPSTTNNAPISPYYGVNVQILRPPPKAGTAQGDAAAP